MPLLPKYDVTANTYNDLTPMDVGATSVNIYSNMARHHLLLHWFSLIIFVQAKWFHYPINKKRGR